MYFSKGNEWKRMEWNEMELSNLNWMFSNNGMKMNEM